MADKPRALLSSAALVAAAKSALISNPRGSMNTQKAPVALFMEHLAQFTAAGGFYAR